MKQLLLPLFIMLLSLSQPQVAAQRMTISQPLDGAVYQQNGQGTGRVIIRGDFNSRSFLLGTFYILIGRLQKLDLVNGQPTADAPIQFPLRQQRTTFAQEVTVPKGWYELTITAQKIAGSPFGPRTVTSSVKVGVGEVFIIAGQSNAEGGHRENGDSGPFVLATNTDLFRMDAVRVIDQATGQQDWRNYPNDYKEVKQLTSTKTAKQIGPRGRSLWYWASVGGQLAQDCGVPVAFFNAGFGGTTITQWATSTNPKARASGQYNVANQASPTADRYGPGAPYGFFGNMLGLYASTYGIRAVLWMQGENDTKAIIQKDEQIYAEGWANRPLYEQGSTNPILPPTNAPN